MKILKETMMIMASLFLLACEAQHDPIIEKTEETQNLKTQYGFAEIRDQILRPHCISCHTNRHDAYENYAVVKASAQAILARVTARGREIMPPREFNKPLAQEQIDALKEWVEAGAPEEGNLEEPRDIPEPSAGISFQDIKDKILEPKCIGCHSQYENYAVVKNELGSIFGQVMGDKMPFSRLPNRPPVALKKSLKDLLSDWVNAGAPYTASAPEGPADSTLNGELKPNWLSLRDRVFGPKCILCHNKFGPRGPTAFNTYGELLLWSQNDPLLFKSENPHDSRFVGSMIGRINPDNNEFFFDPMPFNKDVDDVQTDFQPVSPEEIEVIEKWIELGLPYDEPLPPPLNQ